MNSENISLKYLTAKPNNLFVNWLAKQEQENEPSLANCSQNNSTEPSPEPRAKPKKMDEEKSGIESTWVTLNKFPRYEISKTIPYVVREKVLKRIIPQSINNVGYYQLSLNGQNQLLHRIIAEQFIPKSDGLDEINHKNHNKLDNRIENLEWISHSDNLSNRKAYKKQKSEMIDEIGNKCIQIKNFDLQKLDRYFFDKENQKIYLKRSNGKGYRLLKPTWNGSMNIVSLMTTDGRTITRSYSKLMRYLNDNY